MKNAWLIAVVAAFALAACGQSDAPKSAPAAGSTAAPSAPTTPAPQMDEKKDAMKK
jgi:predicted small lipoprotein YifL